MAEPRKNLTSLLDELARRPDRPAFALRTPYRRFTWTAGETHRAALAFAGRLRDSGLLPGERVLIQGPNSPEWVAAFFGITAAGCIAVPLDESIPPDLFRRIAAKVEAKRAVVASRRSGELQGNTLVVELLESLHRLRGEDIPTVLPHQAEPNDTAEIIFTSGTTAEPKGVELSHANLLVNLAGIERGFLRREWYLRWLLPFRLLCLVPVTHLFGQSVGILIPILFRSTSVFSSTLQPLRLLQFIRREKPLAVLAVPRTLGALSEAVRRELDRRGRLRRFQERYRGCAGRSALWRTLATRDIRRVLGWRTWIFVVGGAPLDPDVEEFWARCGFAVVQGYGMTEAAPVVTISNPLEGVRGTIGRRIGRQEVRLAPDGEILVRGPNVMKGYYSDPTATHEVLEDNWLRTGDLGELDAEGRLIYKGRKKEVIVTAEGMNVFPADVEQVLRRLPKVRDAVVFSLPGAFGEEIHAAVLAQEPGADPKKIQSRANERLLPHQRLREVVLWDQLDFPRTSTGKVKRREVAATVLASRAGRQDRTEPGTEVPVTGPLLRPSRAAAALARLRPEIARSVSTLPPGTRLAEDLGLSSLEIVELVGLLEEESDIPIDDRLWPPSVTLGDLDRLVSGPAAAAPVVEGPWRNGAPRDSQPEDISAGDASARDIRKSETRGRDIGAIEPRARDREAETRPLGMPRWGCRLPVRWLRAVLRAAFLRPLFGRFVKLEVIGQERLRGLREPFLLVANHTSLLDTPSVLFALPRLLRGRLAPAMAIETVPNRLLYNLAVLLFNAYPMPQSRGFRPSLEHTGELMDEGFFPLVFPEGHMTRDGRMAPFKEGIGLLALETRALVVPVLLEGLHSIMPPGSRWPARGRARVILGQPFLPLAQADVPPPAVRAAAEIERAVRSLRAVGDPAP